MAVRSPFSTFFQNFRASRIASLRDMGLFGASLFASFDSAASSAFCGGCG